MRTRWLWSALAGGVAVLSAAQITQAGIVVYRENFSVTDNAQLGWSGYANTTVSGAYCKAWDGFRFGGATGGEPRISASQVSSQTGGATSGTNINAGADVTAIDKGYLWHTDGSTAAQAILMFTSEYIGNGLALDISDVDNIRFLLGQRNWTNSTPISLSKVRVAVKVAGSWYVSQQAWKDATQSAGDWNTGFTINGGTAPLVGVPTLVDLAMASAQWNALTVTPDVSLAMGTGITMPSTGSVDAFGYFFEDGLGVKNRTVIDTFEVVATVAVAVPEPGTLMLLGLSSMLLLRRRS